MFRYELFSDEILRRLVSPKKVYQASDVVK